MGYENLAWLSRRKTKGADAPCRGTRLATGLYRLRGGRRAVLRGQRGLSGGEAGNGHAEG